ncbi:MAG: hypothetical protein H5T36_02885 [Methanobacteriaceae archaeon]|nr:hypothetical protein [Methanobacteriaceae archaeon]
MVVRKMESKYILLALAIILIAGMVYYFREQPQENVTENITTPKKIQYNQTTSPQR